mgnify:CR=1 FL=1
MEITNEQLSKLFELASMEDKLSVGNKVDSADISKALIKIERKIYSFSESVKMDSIQAKKVLIADDLELSIYQLNILLKRLGVTPIVARNKNEAIAIIMMVLILRRENKFNENCIYKS